MPSQGDQVGSTENVRSSNEKPGWLAATWQNLTSGDSAVAAAKEIEKENAFARKAMEAYIADYSDLEALDLIKTSGQDKLGRAIIWIVGRHLPAQGQDLERIKWFIFREVYKVAEEGDFIVVYTHSETSWQENHPGVRWIRAQYEEIPAKFKDRLKRFYVVHPALWLRLLLRVMGPWATGGFWDKLEYISRVEFLWDYIEKSICTFPDFVMEHDAELETQPLMDYGIVADPSGNPAMYAIGGYPGAPEMTQAHTEAHHRNTASGSFNG